MFLTLRMVILFGLFLPNITTAYAHDKGISKVIRLVSIDKYNAELLLRRNNTIDEIIVEIRKDIEQYLTINKTQVYDSKISAVLASEQKRIETIYDEIVVPETLAEFKEILERSARELHHLREEFLELSATITNGKARVATQPTSPDFRGSILTIRLGADIQREIVDIFERDALLLLKIQNTLDAIYAAAKDETNISQKLELGAQLKKELSFYRRNWIRIINFLMSGATLQSQSAYSGASSVSEIQELIRVLSTRRFYYAFVEEHVGWRSSAKYLYTKYYPSVEDTIGNIIEVRIKRICESIVLGM